MTHVIERLRSQIQVLVCEMECVCVWVGGRAGGYGSVVCVEVLKFILFFQTIAVTARTDTWDMTS